MRPWAWSTFKERPEGDPAAGAFMMLAALATIARATDEEPDLYDELDEQISYESPQMIATCVIELHQPPSLKPSAQAANRKGRPK